MNADQDILRDLKHFISYPTISSDPRRRQMMSACAAWLRAHLNTIGMQRAEIFETATHPVVYAEYKVSPFQPTVLFYGHYDVQPADPLHKWDNPPFDAAVKGNYIFGRGASDDKGQLFIHISAIGKLLKERNGLPVNVKFLIEGAEEIGSEGLKEFIEREKKLLQCDTAVVSDTKMASLHEPAITYSLRGSLNAEIVIQTLGKDLHSGTFGGSVANAAVTLSNFISRLHHKDHSIAIPGMYDDVINLLPGERAYIKAHGISDDSLLQDAEAFTAWGEADYSLHERTTIRPSLSITGITAGYQGGGVKNVIPSVASAKLNFRLVPDQTPERVRLLLDKCIQMWIREGNVATRYSSFANPVTVPRNNPYVRAAARAYERVFRKKIRFVQNGGTIAAVDHLHTILGVPVVLMGFAQAGDNMHAPNEKFYLPNFFKGMDTVKLFIQFITS
jgi:acetylornithine deacetylase/succinyl-diaminopimelate desuccinylase-like protein